MKKSTLALAVSVAVLALGPLAASAQGLPGKHPVYLHALTDLRTARWLLEHQPGDTQVHGDEDVAITEVDATINDIKQASIDDGKDLHDHPNVDVHEHGSRLLRSIESLRKARADIGGEEDDPQTRDLRHRSIEHLDHALHAAEQAHEAWLKDARS